MYADRGVTYEFRRYEHVYQTTIKLFSLVSQVTNNS